MLKNIFVTFISKKCSRSSWVCARQLCTRTALIEQQMRAMQQQQQQFSDSDKVSIYRVPPKLRKVEPGAYDPQFISIGPYHHGLPNLKDSERLKLRSLNRVVGLGGSAGDELSRLFTVVGAVEQEARGCYSEVAGLSRDEFVNMLLLDGCFIVQLFRDLKESNFAYSSLLTKRWMLPVVRRDLITLENQLPMIVLKKLFEETNTKSTEETSLEELALRFFDPLMPREPHILREAIESCTKFDNGVDQNSKHLLDLFQSSISLENVRRGKEPHMYRSVAELKEAGIKVRVLRNSQPLRLTFEVGVLMGGVLRIPRLQIDDQTGSFFRNIVAYEQCHQDCKPDMTTYLFFLDKLINSAEDVGLLHYGGVIQHSLGSNKQLAKLVNKLCLEVEHDGQESYLCDVVGSLNSHSNQWWVKTKAKLKHGYFTNLWVSLSTIAGILLLYLTLVQTTCDVVGAQYEEEQGWWHSVNLFLIHPISEIKSLLASAKRSIVEAIDPKDPPAGDPKQCI